MQVIVLGANGVLGRQVVPRLVERGHTVRAVLRRPEQAVWLVTLGVEAIMGDILQRETLLAPASGCEAALHLATAIPRPGGTRDWSLNDRIRREGTENLLAACEKGGVIRYLQQSIIFIYGERGSTWLDEDTPVQPGPVTASAIDMESLVRGSNLETCILRGGALYGPGTGREVSWRQAAREGRLRFPGDGQGYISLVHEVDLARAVVQAVESAPPDSVFNVVDDEPVTYRVLYEFIAGQLGAPPPRPEGPPYLPSLRCSNARIKQLLGWEPAYPSYRSGLVESS